ncbi:hypothetical protein [Dehalogenimonas alkenigignens]|uniref:Phage shock protein B n=1 Tax=Dehalogenimonas alkenigignens TaxID=1217799 RepID=A0A0W0GG55_9CHLR|nr:hypothetical protein [Dehalogenimonas alkenigignens]KTB47545.1 hypothetical protein DEALK_03900 [Dehalogenimonas alkenigignens]PVV83402.1 hypothetical protein DD509_06090 [Dehalogenimonas alkenigignens]
MRIGFVEILIMAIVVALMIFPIVLAGLFIRRKNLLNRQARENQELQTEIDALKRQVAELESRKESMQ